MSDELVTTEYSTTKYQQLTISGDVSSQDSEKYPISTLTPNISSSKISS